MTTVTIANDGSHLTLATADEKQRFHAIWLRDNAPDTAIAFRATSGAIMEQAVLDGAGIGFLPEWKAAECDDLVQVMAPQPDWMSTLWLVTHVDLHRTNKVQAFTQFLKRRAGDWKL